MSLSSLDKKAKQLLEENIDPKVATWGSLTWGSLREGAALKEHFRDVARGLKKP